MAIIDYSLQLAKAQADVRSAGSYYSTNVIDLGPVRGVKIIEERGVIQIRVAAAYVGGTSVDFQLVCASSPWTTPAGAGIAGEQVLQSTGAIATASLTINTIVAEFPIPQNVPKRYLGIKAVSLGTFSAGTHDINVAAGVSVGPY